MKDRGFSLLEMVAVLAIFALVALIGVQVIGATLKADRRLSGITEANGELAVALALLRRDLDAGISLPFYPGGGGAEPALRVAPGADSFSLSIGGLAGIGARPDAGLGRVTWRYDRAGGQLIRQLWTVLAPGGARAAGPEVAVLSDVVGMDVASFATVSGWSRGYASDPRAPDDLPRAIRVRLQHRTFGTLETVVALR